MEIKLIHRDTMSVEAIVRRIPNGDLILLCTCGGLVEPAIQNRTYIFKSHDDGLTWDEGEQIHKEDGLAHYHTETAVIGDKIRVYISEHNGEFVGWHNYYLESTDNANTWERHNLVELPEYAFVRSKVVLSNGDIMFPFHYYPVTKEMEDKCYADNTPGYRTPIPYIESGYLLSSDGGKTFTRHTAFKTSMEWLRTVSICRWAWPENTIVEYEKGHLIMLFRLDYTFALWRSDSFDYGKTWSDPIKTDIPNPSNKPQLLKWGNKIVLMNTPVEGKGLEARHPLEIWISDDGMKTWYKKIRISDFPGAYSYPNGFIEGNKLYLSFEFNRHDIYFAVIDLEND